MRRIRLFGILGLSVLAALVNALPAQAGLNLGNHNETFLRG